MLADDSHDGRDWHEGLATMRGRIRTITGSTVTVLAAMPASAFAADGSFSAPGSPLRMGVSLLGLAVAVVLLVEALAVRKVALGGAIADKISYVILAIICLAASAIAQWTGNFFAGFTQEQIALASELLVIVAMVLLAAYFYSVRKAMQAYLSAMTGSEALRAEATATERDGDDA